MPRSQRLPRDVEAFITDCIQSVEQIDILLLLSATRDRAWTPGQLSAQLRRSEHSVVLRIHSLIANGLVAMENGKVCYVAPPSEDERVRQLGEIYEQRRAAVIGCIFGERSDPMKTFADAFRVRRDDDDR